MQIQLFILQQIFHAITEAKPTYHTGQINYLKYEQRTCQTLHVDDLWIIIKAERIKTYCNYIGDHKFSNLKLNATAGNPVAPNDRKHYKKTRMKIEKYHIDHRTLFNP